MRICLIVEGAYPYINGGMSNWIQQLMLRMPDVEFVIQSIASTRDESRTFRYQIPDNCMEIQEVYLMDDDNITSRTRSKLRLTGKEYDAFESFLFGEKADWDTIMRFFGQKDVSLNALLTGQDFLSMALNYYNKFYSRFVFTDFLWTLRSMCLPLFTILKAGTMEADLYHSASAGYAGILASLEKSIYHKPFIMSEHGIYTREREEEIIKADWVKGIYKDLWIKQFRKIGDCAYQYADVVTSLFEDARQFQIELGCAEEKTIVIPNGMNPERFAHCVGKEPNDPFINVGALLRVTPIKDVKTMINAYALAKLKNPNLKLWIMGDLEEAHDYAAECIAQVRELNLRDVEFTGVINAADYIGKMDIMLLSSLSEGQPLSILEAFTAKKPFVCTNVGNCRGLLEGEFDDFGPAGFVVPIMSSARMADAILKLAGDEELRRKMGEIGYRRVCEHYDEASCYGRYHQLYEDTIKKGPRLWQESGLN